MTKEKQSKAHKHFLVTYPISTGQKLYSIFVTPMLAVILIVLAIKVFSLFPGAPQPIIYASVVRAFFYTFFRLLVAYIFAIIIAIPLALLADSNPRAEKFLLPTFDIIESVPVLAFFPLIIAIFIKYGSFEMAAIFILFLAMLWNIVFSLIGGLKVVPSDIKSAAKIFGLKRLSYFWEMTMPSSVPYLITGSLLAWAQGWNLIIVAEVLHTYIPGGNSSSDLFGIGSMLVNSAASNEQSLFIIAIVTMIVGIGIINFFVWQKLLHYAERFKFE